MVQSRTSPCLVDIRILLITVITVVSESCRSISMALDVLINLLLFAVVFNYFIVLLAFWSCLDSVVFWLGVCVASMISIVDFLLFFLRSLGDLFLDALKLALWLVLWLDYHSFRSSGGSFLHCVYMSGCGVSWWSYTIVWCMMLFFYDEGVSQILLSYVPLFSCFLLRNFLNLWELI